MSNELSGLVFTQQPFTVDELPEICMAAVFHDEEDSISVDDHFVYLHQTSLNRHALDNVRLQL